MLEEVKAHDEAQLQELLKAHPELLPLEDLGLAAPALVVGRESVLASGRIDLVLLANGGELVIVEFKTRQVRRTRTSVSVWRSHSTTGPTYGG